MSLIVDAFEKQPASGEVLEVAPGVLWLRMPLPFALDHINLYLLQDDDGWVVVDTGLAGPATEAIWENVVAQFLADKPLQQLIVTHGHPDHIGSAGWISQRWNVPLWITAREYQGADSFLRDTQGISEQRQQAQYEFFQRLAMADGDISAVTQAKQKIAQLCGALPQTYCELTEDTVFTIGGNRWTVLIAEGHSPAHAMLYCEALNILISGDQVLPRISSNVSVTGRDLMANPLDSWLKSLGRVKSLIPEDTLVLPAHNVPFHGLHTRLDELDKGHERTLRRLEEACDKPRTVMELVAILFPRELSPVDLVLASGECLAHLYYLVHQQRLVRVLEPRDGVGEVFLFSARIFKKGA